MENWRVNLVLVFIVLFGAALISRLAFIQIINSDLNKALAQGQQKIFNIVTGERGNIFFNKGEILATNIKGIYVFISPAEIEEKARTIKELSAILNIDEQKILEKVQKDTLFEKIENSITEEQRILINELGIKGIYCREALFRNYPQKDMASQVVGFLGGEDFGQYGLEGYYDDTLRGKEEIEKKKKGSTASFFSENIDQLGKGSDIVLTIDYNIQFMAEKLLKKAKNDLSIDGGQIIVVDPKTGKILALAHYPNFDPNDYSSVENFDIFQNGTTQKLFEPGSGFKPITMASAINEEKVSPQTTYIDTGKVKIGKYTIENYNGRVFGEKTMTGVLEKSINTGAVFAEKELGHDLFLKYIDSFGFFELTGIDLEGEVFSENKMFKRGYEINFATASFGQGIEITPIQLVRAYTAIANEGKLIKPYVVDKIIKNNEIIETIPDVSSENVISSKTASQVTAMLVSVIENGYGKDAKIPGYYVAGKTGTAQVSEGGGYSSDKSWQSFIGFAPALNPRFLILVKLDNPETKTAEYSALPIFKELAKYIINYWEISPDYD
ncbi:penicillin-binding protein 2 [Patescibacteria group bacterium]|nr:penicillin-binding protein 2 [Patescibacteria group bacterium]